MLGWFEALLRAAMGKWLQREGDMMVKAEKVELRVHDLTEEDVLDAMVNICSCADDIALDERAANGTRESAVLYAIAGFLPKAIRLEQEKRAVVQ